MPPMTDLPEEISVTDTAARLADPAGAPLLLDCRTPDEHAIARIAGAVLIPMQELPDRVAELEPHRDRPIIVHCHHGMRSLRVTTWLRGQGFPHVQSMQGGIDAWSAEVDPTVPTY
jgi:rhodanese-related sulfurtransferase